MGLMDDIFEKAKDVTNAATKKTDSIVKISKLKIDSVQLSNAIKNDYERLGSIVYEQFKSDEQGTEAIMALIEVIDNRYKELNECTHKLEELQNIIVCGKCSTRNKNNSLYCTKCGARIAPVTEVPQNDEDDENDTGFEIIE